MIRRCWRCRGWVVTWPWQRPYCRDVEACLLRYWRNVTVSMATRRTMVFPRWMPEPDREVLPPPDPEGIEWSRPEDMHVCGVCSGSGRVLGRRDYETGMVPSLRCEWCDGTGVEPTYRQSSQLRARIRQTARYFLRMEVPAL